MCSRFYKAYDPTNDSVPCVYFFLARVRPRRFHSQVTHVIVNCITHLEADGLFLSLGQRAPRLFDFWTLWRLARELLQGGAIAVRIDQIEHENSDRSTVLVREGADDDSPSYDVWPNQFRRVRGRHIPLDGDADAAPRRRRRARTGGVIGIPPSAALEGRPQPGQPGRAAARARPAAGAAAEPRPPLAPAAALVLSDDDIFASSSDSDRTSEDSRAHIKRVVRGSKQQAAGTLGRDGDIMCLAL